MALLALTMLSLFLSGSAFLVMQEARASRDGLTERRALEAAEYGAAAVLRDWNQSTNLAAPVGVRIGPWNHALAGGARAAVYGVRTTATTFWIVSEGSAGANGTSRLARRVVNALLRLDVPEVRAPAALTVRDSAIVTGTGRVLGADSVLGGRSLVCSSGITPAAGVAAPDTTHVCDGSCGSPPAGRILGSPPLLTDTAAANPAPYQVSASAVLASLAARADITLPPGAVVIPGPVSNGGACQRGLPTNWGDPAPAAPCADYRPVIYAQGDVTIAGGVGQGILLADGDVRIAGGAKFVGLVIAGDDVETLTGGGTILGAAFAGDLVRGASDYSRIGDGGAVRYSTCAVRLALFAAAPIRRVRTRWWAELF